MAPAARLPEDGGQTVDVQYALDAETEMLYQMSADLSTGEVVISRASIDGGEFAPWNGDLPDHEEFTEVAHGSLVRDGGEGVSLSRVWDGRKWVEASERIW
jgi:hypothetical protein